LWYALVLDKVKQIKSLDKRNKNRMQEKNCNRLLLRQCATRLLTQSGKQQQKSIAIVFRFAMPQLYFKCGVPQTPESNTKVLLKEVLF